MSTIEMELKRYRTCTEKMNTGGCELDEPCDECEFDMSGETFRLFRKLAIAIEGYKTWYQP